MLGCPPSSIIFESVGSFIASVKDVESVTVDDFGDEGDDNIEVLVSENAYDTLGVDRDVWNDVVQDDVAEVNKLFAPLDAAIAAAAARVGELR